MKTNIPARFLLLSGVAGSSTPMKRRLGFGLLVFGLSAVGCGQSTGTGGGPSSGAASGSSGAGGGAGAGASGGAGAGTSAGASGGTGAGTGAGASGDAGAGTTGSGTGSSGSSSDAGGVDAGAGDAMGAAEAGAGCSAPGTLCWDFEQGVLPPGWTRSRNEYGGALVVDATKPHPPSMYSLHAKDFSGGTPGQQGGPKRTIIYSLPANFGPVLWGRAFVFTTPAAPDSHAGLFNARYPRPNSAATAMNTLDWYEVATFTQKYMTIWHPPEPPGYPEDVLVSDKPAVIGSWACLEWLFDGTGMANEAAQPRMWVDGTELNWPMVFTYPDGGPPFREKAANFIELETGIYLYQGLAQVTNWWIDDLAVGPQRIGCN